MNRRELVSTALRLGATSGLSGLVASIGIPSLGSRRNEPWLGERISINRTGIDATITDRSSTSVTVQLRSDRSVSDFVPVAYKRRYPGGVVFARQTGPRIDTTGPLDRRVTFEFDRSLARFVPGRWLYEIRCRSSGETAGADRYLCESDSLQRRSLTRFGPRSEPRPDEVETGRATYDRTEREGRYEVRFRWPGAHGAVRELEYSISKSAFHRARNRTRGYVRTFLESRKNPHARHLTAQIIGDESGKRRGGSAAAEREAFETVVRFVQSFEYRTDEDSKGTYDYHRTVEESLVDGVGDCKDGTYLLAGVLSHPPFEYETALVFMADHLLLGVRRADLPEEYRTVETIDDSPYVAIETTSRQSIGAYRDAPIVAIVGPTYRSVDPDSVGHALGEQLRLFREYYE